MKRMMKAGSVILTLLLIPSAKANDGLPKLGEGLFRDFLEMCLDPGPNPNPQKMVLEAQSRGWELDQLEEPADEFPQLKNSQFHKRQGAYVISLNINNLGTCLMSADGEPSSPLIEKFDEYVKAEAPKYEAVKRIAPESESSDAEGFISGYELHEPKYKFRTVVKIFTVKLDDGPNASVVTALQRSIEPL